MLSRDTDDIIDSISFDPPVEKDSYRIAKPHKKVQIDVIDVKVVNATKLKVGYMLSLHLDTEARKMLKEIDNVSILHLLTHNKEWFHNELTDDEVKDMFYCSYCEQTSTLKAYIRNVQGINVCLNNRPIELSEFITGFCGVSGSRSSMTNVKLQLLGMYVYKKQTINKWCISTINIYEGTEDMETETREEIETFWGEMVERCQEKLQKRIENIEESREDLKSMYAEISQIHGTDEWELKIADLKKLIQNIIFY